VGEHVSKADKLTESGDLSYAGTDPLDEPVMMLAKGFEEAFVGVAYRYGFPTPIAAYDRGKCIESIMEDGCNREDAEEYFEFNVAGAWVGEGTPVFIELMSLDDALSEIGE
jgi:hypothetical protein